MTSFISLTWERLGSPVGHLIADWSVAEVLRIKECFDRRDFLKLDKKRLFYFRCETKYYPVLSYDLGL